MTLGECIHLLSFFPICFWPHFLPSHFQASAKVRPFVVGPPATSLSAPTATSSCCAAQASTAPKCCPRASAPCSTSPPGRGWSRTRTCRRSPTGTPSPRRTSTRRSPPSPRRSGGASCCLGCQGPSAVCSPAGAVRCCHAV